MKENTENSLVPPELVPEGFAYSYTYLNGLDLIKGCFGGVWRWAVGVVVRVCVCVCVCVS